MKGLWENEPDKFDGEHCGYKTAMRRGPMGGWCGYVGIPESHPWFGKHYSDKVKVPQEVIERPLDIDKVGAINLFCALGRGDEDAKEGWMDMVLAIDVHGGLTFSDACCPKGGPEGLWWLGFDCGHAGDLVPGMLDKYPEWYRGGDDVYRHAEYVKGEVESMAEQLQKFETTEEA